MADAAQAALAAEEEAFEAAVGALLDDVAQQFAAALADATELVAARFSVSRIAGMWRAGIPALLRRLLGTAQTAAGHAADQVDADLPDGWDDLPGRHDRGEDLPAGIGQYVTTTEHLLNAVGDRLSAAAVQALADGVDAGEDMDQLRARLRAVFSRDAAQLGDARGRRIAATEAGRAWNTATLAAARALTGPDRPIVKQWRTRRDTKVREAHDDVDGQVQLLDDPFTVAGVSMAHPGDPTAPPELVVNCRCQLRLQLRPAESRLAAAHRQFAENLITAATPAEAARALALDGLADRLENNQPQEAPPTGAEAVQRQAQLAGWLAANQRALRPYSHRAPRPSSHTEVAAAFAAFGIDPARARPHADDSQEAPPAAFSDPRRTAPMASHTAAADGSHLQGAMIALVPSDAEAQRLAVPGGETAEELHLTLYYLGPDGADFSAEDRASLIASLTAWAQDYMTGPLIATAFGAAHWNAGGDEPSWVWSVGDQRTSDRPDQAPYLAQLHQAAADALLTSSIDADMLPEQHSPWVPHICAAYSDDPALLPELEGRLGPVTFDRIRVTFGGDATDIHLGPLTAAGTADDAERFAPVRTWSTPGETALAYEDEETGDGRVFAAGALYWEEGPWPLQYADEMLGGHEGAELAGAIKTLARDGGRITATGDLYLTRWSGMEAADLLDQGAPLGISVDLDDVSVEFIDRRSPEGDDDSEGSTVVFLSAELGQASITQLPDGAWAMRATAPTRTWTAAGAALLRTGHTVEWTTAPDGTIPATAVRTALTAAGITLTAAAGDPDQPDQGEVVHSESAGDLLMRVTRARVRGATLVTLPAYNRARIVLDPPAEGTAAAARPAETELAASGTVHDQVVAHVSSAPIAVSAREVADAVGITVEQARSHLRRACDAGRIVRLARGLYIGASTLPEDEVTAAMSGDTDLPILKDREHEWDGPAAASRVLAWATGEDDKVDADRLGRAFLYRDPDRDPATLAAYKLGHADVIDNRLQIIPRGVFAVAAVLQGSQGGADVPADEQDQLRHRVSDLYARLADALDDPGLHAPWDDDQTAAAAELEASAWTAMRDTDPMPAEWFREPTPEELPPGSGGVHYAAGRIYGWVAQTGEPHAGFPGRNLTIESLGQIDTSHFLRAKFRLDNGRTIRAGAMTMNVGHHRDGAECETSACQFDDTRTVAGIVTVGQNDRGMWFSGAAAPWLSEWDRQVFAACQPSYHMKQGAGGRWQLRAVLSVPVPGHSSPLLASAVAERSNLALAASASAAATSTDTVSGQPDNTPPAQDTARPDSLPEMSGIVTALTQPAVLDAFADALAARAAQREASVRAEIDQLSQLLAPARAELAADRAA
ncbi:phage minor head protein [Actinacidiphila sp. DG2A-62]|uniref:phage minor head protein n=1 Tax=Actinacidiphila sp. DG2A-62 TaxID=3108821 RepID=UPI002DBB91B7|nr:phage minor head protein [Actinacidiphila sp. DG2A-62]MEC3995166.1 phage minor head protein [Actinacidiphila sp. DG2A-62]